VAAIHVRSFAPAHGIAEDPVCGTGNIGVAAFLRQTKNPLLRSEYIARQGAQLGRDGRVHMRIAAEDIYLGGNSVTCVDGSLAA
jgi:PhzF family phenazine biosynthesis protein